MTLSSSATADHIYATGLRNQWHAVVPSHFVAPGAMRKVTALGEQHLDGRHAHPPVIPAVSGLSGSCVRDVRGRIACTRNPPP